MSRPILAELKRVLCSFAEIFFLLLNLGMAFGFVSGNVYGVRLSVRG